MSLPPALKSMALFVDGGAYIGEVASVTIPKLARTMEEWRGGGMQGKVSIDMGQEPIEISYKAGGVFVEALKSYGAPTVDALQHRWVGVYQDDGSNEYTKVEIVTRGRHKEIDQGEAKSGEIGEQNTSVTCSYYRLTIDGADIIEIDMMTQLFVVNGVDRNAELRALLGI